jgi:hypothetical protein
MPRGGKVKSALRKRIRELLRTGETQASIARKLHKANSTIAYHCRLLGIEPRKYFGPLRLHKGKRRCDSCLKRKGPGAFPDDRTPTCKVCVGKKGTADGKARGS